MAKLGYVSRGAGAGGAARAASGSTSPTSYFEHREPYFFDYVENQLIDDYGVDDGAPAAGSRSTRRSTSSCSEVGLEAMRSRPALLDRPLLGAGLDRPPQRPHPGDGLQLQLRREPVQPRRPGAPPAGLDLQGLRPDHGDQAGDRPLLDLLHLETARPRPAATGATGRSHTADEGYQGTVNLQQATVTSDNTVFAQLDLDVGPEERRADGEVDGDHHRSSTGSRPRGSAACGSASRRWR